MGTIRHLVNSVEMHIACKNHEWLLHTICIFLVTIARLEYHERVMILAIVTKTMQINFLSECPLNIEGF